jgi:hypothetical protein
MDDIDAITATVRDELRPHAAKLAGELLFIEQKLDETRVGLANQAVVIPYDNGGGQTGIRANPAFKEYNALLSSFCKALSQLNSLMSAAPVKPEAKSTLERFQVVKGRKLAVGDE